MIKGSNKSTCSSRSSRSNTGRIKTINRKRSRFCKCKSNNINDSKISRLMMMTRRRCDKRNRTP